jgi:trehalose/maltose hydrolase-like predicted phosphorylase
MSPARTATAAAPRSAALGRRFEAIVSRWDGAALAGRRGDATQLRRLVEDACAVGLEVVLVSRAPVAEVDAQLGARPSDPGGLWLLLDRGSEAFRVDRDGVHLVHGEPGSTDETDSVEWIRQELWRRGIAPAQVLDARDRLGPLGTGLGALADLLESQIECRRHGEVPIVDTDRSWILTVDGVDSLLERAHESLLTIADGRLGTRGSIVIGHPSDEPGVLVSGVYVGEDADTRLLPAPRWNAIATDAPDHAPIRRGLDLHAGVLHQCLGTPDARLEVLLLSSLARPGTAVLRAYDRGRSVRPGAGLLAPAGVTLEEGTIDDCRWMRTTGLPGSIVAAVRQEVRDEIGGRVLDRVASYDGAPDEVVDEGPAVARVQRDGRLGFDALLVEHRRAWAARWEDADVRIDGDPELQIAARFAFFHLLATVGEHDEAAVGARGLSGGAYRGHVFWDSDVYVLPFLTATHPAAARAMLEYRVRRLPAALRAARAQGRVGARLPWESATSGTDVTPEQAPGRGGEMAPVLTGLLEEHIVADVAWAAGCYVDWTGDRAFAAGPGRELLVQTARWWASRIELDSDGTGHIRDVMGPDEYHAHVDDNAYTNVMSRWNLRRAAVAAAGEVDERERRRWLELADALVDGYDPASGLYEQFAGFYELEPLVITQVAPQRPVAADILLGAARTRAAQVVKQPDVLMLHYVVPEETATGSLEPNLDFYEPRTAHGSSLSPGVHAALLARARRPEQALDLLRITARIDLDDISQTTAGGLHLAAMGSLWGALALGFAGLRPTSDALAIDPVLAPGWQGLELRARFRGSRVRARMTPDAVEISADPPIMVLTPAGERCEVSTSPAAFAPSRSPGATPA